MTDFLDTNRRCFYLKRFADKTQSLKRCLNKYRAMVNVKKVNHCTRTNIS
jgi:hypothetical protein